MDRSEEVGRDWTNPVELIAFSQPAPAPASAPAPAPEAAPAPAAEQAPAAEPEAAPVDHLPCLADYSRLTNKWEIEEARSLPPEAQTVYCQKLAHAALYENIWVDFFQATPEQMMPDNPDPAINYRDRAGWTTPVIGTGGLEYGPDHEWGLYYRTGFSMSYSVTQFNVDDPFYPLADANNFSIESLEALVGKWGYCKNQDRVTANPVGGWDWECSIEPTTGLLASYHPTGSIPNFFVVSATLSAENPGLTMSMTWAGTGWQLP